MNRKLGTLNKVWRAGVTAVLVSVGGLVAVASPTAAAVPPVWILNRFGTYCLDQHFTNEGAATTLVRTWPAPCHTVGNQQWRFEFVGSPNSYRIVNHRWDPRGLWCLSAPNGEYSEVFAELCDPRVPLKQRWWPNLDTDGYNDLYNESSHQCLEQDPDHLTRVYVDDCTPNNHDQQWMWH